MDETKLGELFRDAIPDAPPASFDQQDVVAASRRATVRFRTRLAVGTSLGVALLAGSVMVGGNLLGDSRDSDGAKVAAASAGRGISTNEYTIEVSPTIETGGATILNEPPTGGPPPKSFPEEPPLQGGGSSGNAGPGPGSTPTGCGIADRELAVALAGEFPAAAGQQPFPVDATCPPGSRAAAYLVRDGDRVGVLAVVLAPAGGQPEFARPDGTRAASATASNGGRLTLISTPRQGSSAAPFTGGLSTAATRLATHF